jgi:hypothetical protein
MADTSIELETTAKSEPDFGSKLSRTAETPNSDSILEIESEAQPPLEEHPLSTLTKEGPEAEVEILLDTPLLYTLNNHYNIYPGRPLPEFNSPSAQAFEAEDDTQPENKLFGLICLPGMPVRWDEISKISGQLLLGNMSLVSYGNIDWASLGQKCLALIFERPLGGKVDILFKDPQIPERKKVEVLQLIIKTGVTALHNLQLHNLTNRNIRPDNLYFLDAKKEEIIFGEFVSSPPGFEQPVAFEPIERGMAGKGGRGLGTLEDDIYGLGATLAHLLQRQGRIRGKTDEQILLEKTTTSSYQTLVGKRILTSALLVPIRGMLSDNDQRWGLNELDMWLRDEPVVRRQSIIVKQSLVSINLGNFYHRHPRSLAHQMSIHRKSALVLIKNGAIARWFSEGIGDKDLAATINSIVENATKTSATTPQPDDQLLSQILILMDPEGPIRYKNISYMHDGFGPALAIEALTKGDLNTYAESVIHRLPNIWYQASAEAEGSIFTELEYYAAISRHLQKTGPGFGIERCLYETNKGYACQSPIIAKENVFTLDQLLPALNAVEVFENTEESPIDQHIGAFIAARSQENIDGFLTNLDTAQALSVLRLLVYLQRKTKAGQLINLKKWIVGQIGPLSSHYHNLAKRKEIEAEITNNADSGDLSALLSVLQDPVAKQKDDADFLEAVQEFDAIKKELGNIEKNTGPESLLADQSSKRAAAIISALIMIFIVLMIFLAA